MLKTTTDFTKFFEYDNSFEYCVVRHARKQRTLTRCIYKKVPLSLTLLGRLCLGLSICDVLPWETTQNAAFSVLEQRDRLEPSHEQKSYLCYFSCMHSVAIFSFLSFLHSFHSFVSVSGYLDKNWVQAPCTRCQRNFSIQKVLVHQWVSKWRKLTKKTRQLKIHWIRL